MANKARHAFGSTAKISEALADGKIDEYDILFLNDDGKASVGWIQADGTAIVAEGKERIVPVTDFPATGEKGVLYIKGDFGYIWDGTEFKKVFGNEAATEQSVTVVVEQKLDNVVTTKVDNTIDEKLAPAVSQALEDELSIIEF